MTASSAAVIVGFELNGLGVARALAAYGVECIGVSAPSPNPAWKTKTCKVVSCAEWSGAVVLAKLIEIGRSRRQKPSLLITKEEPVRWISDAREQLAEYYEINLPHKPVVDLLLDKTDFGRLCAAEDWPAPRTWRIESKSDLLDALPQIPFPCILKPRVKSAAFGDRSPRKAFKLVDAEDLLRTHEMSAQWTDRFIVQEWIQGGEDRIAFCLTYVDRSGSPQGMFVGRKLRQWPPECGNTALCEPAPAQWREVICALTERIWRRVGFSGLGSIEYKMELGSGQPVLIEPTVGRTNYQSEIAVLNGVNIPLIAHCDLTGLSYPQTGSGSQSYKLVDGIRELRSARYYFASRALTFRRWLRDRRGRSRYMTFRLDDPGPLWASFMESFRASGGGLVQGLFGRRFKNWLKRVLWAKGR